MAASGVLRSTSPALFAGCTAASEPLTPFPVPSSVPSSCPAMPELLHCPACAPALQCLCCACALRPSEHKREALAHGFSFVHGMVQAKHRPTKRACVRDMRKCLPCPAHESWQASAPVYRAPCGRAGLTPQCCTSAATCPWIRPRHCPPTPLCPPSRALRRIRACPCSRAPSTPPQRPAAAQAAAQTGTASVSMDDADLEELDLGSVPPAAASHHGHGQPRSGSSTSGRGGAGRRQGLEDGGMEGRRGRGREGRAPGADANGGPPPAHGRFARGYACACIGC